MTTSVRLSARKREAAGKGAARKARAAGRVPAVIYGHGEQTRPVSVDAHELELLFSRVHYENTVLELDIEGEASPVKVLVREVQAHAFKRSVLHVDFYQIHADEQVSVEVPIRLHGSAPGVKAAGILMHNITELEVRCFPDQIPEYIQVDISALEIGDAVHVRDLKLPEGVEAELEPDHVVCSVAAPIVAAAAEGEEGAAAVVEAEAAAEPEVIRRGKEEGE
ncbi:MAG: 50S ribosomal protein L25/general stress protein Ctc [Gemmatimonadetes bacterium]|nr:50S ribosomal protein L25/general stress protein Ctc [Gemmatimonadota bacterium]